ncbi:prephenate dehydrogenase [Marinobacter halodurans]|uniref:Prephenate dehydrogenase n=1 Tax=Marinobacter halodurans TaxID=2528979 RepID=A0ABY1ZDL7_9GAMM|nr:prephenate dehydrogenase dimerization domain-containing protein [Marinobacter halodurans]TBW47411.1 prephenate dehydrogenase [Marinobacter halodurans]
MKPKLIVLGAGEVGTWFAGIARDRYDITMVDLAAVDSQHPLVIADILNPTPELELLISEADVIVFALPDKAAIEGLDQVSRFISAQTLVVETLSVKTEFHAAYSELKIASPLHGMQPLFKPTLETRGRGIVYIENESITTPLLECYTQSKAIVKPFSSCEEHDRCMLLFQVLPHFLFFVFGEALRNSEVDIVELLDVAPPPFKTLLAATNRMENGSEHVYWDIQTSNKATSTFREKLIEISQNISNIFGSKDFDSYKNVFSATRNILGTKNSEVLAMCSKMYEHLDNTNSDS